MILVYKYIVQTIVTTVEESILEFENRLGKYIIPVKCIYS